MKIIFTKCQFTLRYFVLSLLCCCTVFTTNGVYAVDDPLMLGVFPRRNATETVSYFKPLAEYLSKRLNREVRLVTAKNFPTFWKGVKQKRFDIVHYNQLHYVISNEKFGYKVIAKNNEFGRNTIAGTLVVRKDSQINSIKDLRGKTILFGGGKKALVAYVANTLMLRRAGLERGDYVERFSKNPPNATIAIFKKQADAAGVGDVALEIPIVKNKTEVDQLVYLSHSEQLPHIPWAVKDSLPLDTKLKIQELITELDKTVEGRQVLESANLSRIVVAEDADYDVVRDLMREFKEKF